MKKYFEKWIDINMIYIYKYTCPWFLSLPTWIYSSPSGRTGPFWLQRLDFFGGGDAWGWRGGISGGDLARENGDLTRENGDSTRDTGDWTMENCDLIEAYDDVPRTMGDLAWFS